MKYLKQNKIIYAKKMCADKIFTIPLDKFRNLAIC